MTKNFFSLLYSFSHQTKNNGSTETHKDTVAADTFLVIKFGMGILARPFTLSKTPCIVGSSLHFSCCLAICIENKNSIVIVSAVSGILLNSLYLQTIIYIAPKNTKASDV